jgi:hypothetical protein
VCVQDRVVISTGYISPPMLCPDHEIITPNDLNGMTQSRLKGDLVIPANVIIFPGYSPALVAPGLRQGSEWPAERQAAREWSDRPPAYTGTLACLSMHVPT